MDEPTERGLELAERIFQLGEREDLAGFSYHGQLGSVSKARRLVVDLHSPATSARVIVAGDA
jgi:hypothetical protein